MIKYFLLIGLIPSLVMAQTITWDVGNGTWDDTTTTNWSPAQIPAPGNNVTINRAGGATVVYASSAFDDPDDFLSNITIGGNGDSSVLQVGDGDILRFDNSLNLNSGGRLEITGGLVQDNRTGFGTTVNIGNNASMLITGGVLENPGLGNFLLANSAGQTASLEVSGTGQILGNTEITGASGDFAARAGNSTLLLADDGRIEFSRNALVGNEGGTHNWTITSGTFTKVNGQNNVSIFGNNDGNGSVTVNQSGGTVNFIRENHASFGDTARINQTAHYTLSGDPEEVFFRTANFAADGQFTQNGGDVFISFELTLGTVADGHAVYTATAGNMRSRGVTIANVADASATLTLHEGVDFTTNPNTNQAFIIGATSGSGTGTLEIIGLDGLSGTGFRWVRIHETGVVRGYGVLAGTNDFVMNGRIIADGYGSDQTLDFSGRAGMTNTVDNTTDKGLYAINGGKLLLANVAVAAGNTTVNWGEDPSDTTIDLVNSVRLSFADATAGALTGSLLAIDRMDIPEFTFFGDVISVHEFTSDFTFDNLDMIIRYDDSQVTDADLLRLFHYSGGIWNEVPNFSVNTSLSQFTANDIESFSLFALTVIPEPSSSGLLLLAVAAACLLRARRTAGV